MATLRNERKLAATNKNNHEDHPRKNQARNTNSLRNQEDYITKVSKEVEGRVKKKLSQDFSRTDSRIMDALSRLDEFLLNPKFRVHSVTFSEISRISNREN